MLLGKLQNEHPLGVFGNIAYFSQETNTAIDKYKHIKVAVSTDGEYLTNPQKTYGSLFIKIQNGLPQAENILNFLFDHKIPF